MRLDSKESPNYCVFLSVCTTCRIPSHQWMCFDSWSSLVYISRLQKWGKRRKQSKCLELLCDVYEQMTEKDQTHKENSDKTTDQVTEVVVLATMQPVVRQLPDTKASLFHKNHLCLLSSTSAGQMFILHHVFSLPLSFSFPLGLVLIPLSSTWPGPPTLWAAHHQRASVCVCALPQRHHADKSTYIHTETMEYEMQKTKKNKMYKMHVCNFYIFYSSQSHSPSSSNRIMTICTESNFLCFCWGS